jgi:superfamily II DNA/RNA helicase
MQKKLFSELGLSPEVLKAVEKMGFEEASPIQSEAIPVLLGGSDVVGQSQTGSGKTAAFAIPAIEKVDGNLRAPQVLILCPTRELAVQVAEEVAKRCPRTPDLRRRFLRSPAPRTSRWCADYHRHARPGDGSPRAEDAEARSHQDGHPR